MLSQLDLEDVEALYLGPSFLTADPMGPLLDQDEEEALSPSSSLEGKAPASLPLSFTSYQSFLSSSPSSSSSPPSPRPASPLGTKAGTVPLSALPWLDADLLGAHVGADDCKDDAFAGMDWMSEKIDLSDFDLDSLMGSCSPDQAPSSPETLLLDPHMDLELDLDLEMELLPPPPPPVESPKMATEMKSEPASPPPLSPPSPPLPTLELGSEVDVSVAEKPPAATTTTALPPTPPHSDSDSDSGIESSASSPARAPSSPASASASSSRTKPYAKPAPAAGAKPPRVKSGAPRVAERKIKKMEQNKTAATRYRQKKRVEQELLNEECQELERRNRQLADRADSISREIQYLRDLMEEVRKHRRGRGAPQPEPATARP